MKITKLLCVSLVLGFLLPLKAIARTTYTDYKNNWDLCVEYEDSDTVDNYELVVPNSNKKYKYAIMKYCVNIDNKRILAIASIYTNDGKFITVGAFDFQKPKSVVKLFKNDKSFDSLEIPSEVYQTDYNAVFYDNNVTQDELDTFVNKMLRSL